MERDSIHIKRCIEISRSAREHGNHPFGALLVDERTNEVVLEAENTVITGRDVTAHAELNLVRKASQTLSRDVIEHSILFSRYSLSSE